MKKLILLLFLSLFSVLTPAIAQNNSKPLVSIPADQLTEQQKKLIEQSSTQEAVSSWTGMGKEVGEAVNGAVGALTKHAVDFSETKLGTFTMYVIAYKVIGASLIKTIILIFVIFTSIIIYIILVFKYGFDKRVIDHVTVHNKGTKDEKIETKYKTREAFEGMAIIATVVIAMVLLICIGNL
jgi:hypothetical protein